jgi:hypothetical protein
VFCAVTVTVAVLGPLVRSNVLVLRLGVRFELTLASVSVIGPVNPFNGVNVKVDDPVAPAARGIVYGSADTSKSGFEEQVVDPTA